ncbi:MAG: hypothetical protein AVDCRST_MAG86-1745 [uncultured Truepera sp.]|uniref:Uncharacterized protein n=1 Tax=uncultured Truepera sp. TaxID=543023 RepID=A0A6J4V7E3_9DEIN|nr:MAG: hypothetical protein AVDCRST_MAG86-1745 [uncultured Truepera sp.]
MSRTLDAAYDHAFSFWRLLAETNVSFGRSKALVNTAAPIILSNALWYPEPESIADMGDFYREQGVLPSCFLSSALDDKLLQALALTNVGLSRTAQYGFNPVAASQPSDVSVEQVGWTQARTLGEVIAAAHDSPYAVAVGQTLALALQLEGALTAFIAYDGPPVGAMVTLTTAESTAFVLETLSESADAALRARLASEAQTRGKAAFVFEQTATGDLELWG